MRARTAAALAAALFLASLTACSSGITTAQPDPAACKKAMAKAFDDATAAGDKAEKSKRPPACEGVDTKTLERFAGEVMKEWMDSPKGEKRLKESYEKGVKDAIESATPEPTAAGVPDECREWIEDELLDSSTSIEAAAGHSACGELSKEEMDQAIDQVTDDLIEQGVDTTG
ncbi:hypothetical protein [Streptomyces chryseus]